MKCLLLTKGIILQSGEVNKNKVNLAAGAATLPVSDIADIVIRPYCNCGGLQIDWI